MASAWALRQREITSTRARWITAPVPFNPEKPRRGKGKRARGGARRGKP